MSVGVKGILAQAKRAAQRRGQRASTAHLLLVMLQRGGPISELLSRQGVGEAQLLAALRDVDDESASTLERALERSSKLAHQLGCEEPNAWHLLLAITRDARSAGHRSLARAGMGPARVHDEVLTKLGSRPSPTVTPTKRVAPKEGRIWADPRQTRKAARADEARAALGTPTPAPTAAATPGSPTPANDTGADEKPKKKRSRKSNRPAARRDPARAKARRDLDLTFSFETPNTPSVAEPRLPLGELDLDPDHFPLLTGIGRNLTALASDGALDPVIGRDREIDTILDVLSRRRANNPVLVGPPGVGKTAVVEGVAQRLAAGVPSLEGRVVIEVSAGSLVSGTGVRGALADRMSLLREEVRRSSGRVILFIDEIHAIVGGSEGPDDLAGELKTSLARGELPCIGATTDREYRKYFERDAALARRFSAVQIDEPAVDHAIEILKGLAPRYAAHHCVELKEEAITSSVELSKRFLPERFLPDKAVGVLDLAAARARRRGGKTVDRRAVADVIAEQARVPVERLLMRDGERLMRLEELLADRVVGHNDVMSRIADALRKGAAGFRGSRPLGTFLFLGPTGVGKTETAKAISDVFFPGSAMTRIDMSELGESHALARMVGAPPGYVGHDEGGQLTESVRKRPYQLILLDEIEKAHPDVLLALLPLLDEGRMTDGRGRTVDFTNTIIVLTSNLGAEASARRSIGFGDKQRGASGLNAIEAARRSMPPELWNRIDEPLFFAPLRQGEVREIARRLIAGVAVRMRASGVELRFEAEILEALIEAGGFDVGLGARPMRRVIGRLVESPLASALLTGAIGQGDVVTLVLDEDGITYRREAADDGVALSL